MTAQVRPARWHWLTKRLLKLFWHVDVPVMLIVNITPQDCLKQMKTTSQPSVTRLHHRNLFADGRRYHIEPTPAGFHMTTTSKIWWQYRRRTSHSAVMDGTFAPFGDDLFSLRLETHIRLFYLIDVFLLPAFMISLLIYAPWHPFFIIASSLILFVLSWSGHRLNVALEANEMVWFVRKALEEHVVEVNALPAGVAKVISVNPDFEREWERFYSTHRATSVDEKSKNQPEG